MKTIKKISTLLIFIAILFSSSACTVNKKKKCDTCPKWTRLMPQTDVRLANCL